MTFNGCLPVKTTPFCGHHISAGMIVRDLFWATEEETELAGAEEVAAIEELEALELTDAIATSIGCDIVLDTVELPSDEATDEELDTDGVAEEAVFDAMLDDADDATTCAAEELRLEEALEAMLADDEIPLGRSMLTDTDRRLISLPSARPMNVNWYGPLPRHVQLP